MRVGLRILFPEDAYYSIPLFPSTSPIILLSSRLFPNFTYYSFIIANLQFASNASAISISHFPYSCSLPSCFLDLKCSLRIVALGANSSLQAVQKSSPAETGLRQGTLSIAAWARRT